MALSELYEIGKRSRNPLAGVTKGARRGEGGGSLVTPLGDEDEKSEIKVREAEIGNDEAKKRDGNIDQHRPKCMICRLQTSKYNCPSCNIAYCSLTCYQSTKHDSCSRPFLQKSLKEELGRNGDSHGMVDEEERKAMMDVLRRMKSLGDSADEDAAEDGATDGVNEEHEGEDEGVDLDDASIEQLMSMLSPEERARFQAAVEDQDPTQARARALLGKISQVQDDDLAVKPWWERSKFLRPATSSFTHEAEKLYQQSSKAKTASIEYNILAVLLAYAYTIRHVDVHSLQDLQANASAFDEDGMPPLEPVDGEIATDDVSEERKLLRNIVREKLKQFAPFLAVSGSSSKMLLESAEQVTLSFAAAQIDKDAATEPAATTLCFLYKDVEAMITPRLLIEVDSSSNTDTTLLAFSDLSSYLSLPSQKKLLFYAVYWLRLDQAQRKDLQEQVAAEIKRLDIEVQQAEDQERFQAADEAAQQQTVYY